MRITLQQLALELGGEVTNSTVSAPYFPSEAAAESSAYRWARDDRHVRLPARVMAPRTSTKCFSELPPNAERSPHDGSKEVEGERSIAAAIHDAEPFQDPVEKLLADAASNPGVPFGSDALVLLKNLLMNDRARFEAVRSQLKKFHVRVTELDAFLLDRGDPVNGHANSSGLDTEDIVPAQKAVDGAQLLDEISGLLQRHLVLPPHAADTIALWVLFAHCHNCWQISPRLAFLSPEKRCGKSTALAILQSLVPRPLTAANITPAAVFRSVEKFRPTLVIDEADTFLAGRDELKGILNSGHLRSSATVIRVVGDNHEPFAFSTWAPLVIAMIGELPDTLQDRAIVIPLKRKAPHEKVERLRLDRLQESGRPLKSRIVRWVLDHRDQLVGWDREVPPALNDRAADNWRALLSDCRCGG